MSQSKENKVIIDGQTFYGGLNQPNLKFVKVTVDCWEKIFDLLSLRDILAMSQTCQRMRQIGGHYFRENFHGTVCYLESISNISINGCSIKRDDFVPFVDTIYISSENLDNLRDFSSMNLLKSLTTLHLHIPDEYKFYGFENIQINIEAIELIECRITEPTCLIHDSAIEFLASCPNLKCMKFDRVVFESTAAEANLFQRIFPLLEHIEYNAAGDGEIAQLISFLERNPTIKCLRITDNDLRHIPLDKSTAIKLDYLNIDITDDTSARTGANEILNQLKTLHANGFYKKLRVIIGRYSLRSDGELFIRGLALFDALEVLETYQFQTNICHLTQLKELHLCGLEDDPDFQPIATNLVNLERLWIEGTVVQLSSFFRHSKKLKYVIFCDNNSEFNALNLFDLNRVRQMGGMQRKVQIGFYVDDEYLATKLNEKSVSYDLVEITRSQTIRKHFYYTVSFFDT